MIYGEGWNKEMKLNYSNSEVVSSENSIIVILLKS